MELIPILATVIVVTTIITIIFALMSYAAYRFREKRTLRFQPTINAPEFFRRYQPRR